MESGSPTELKGLGSFGRSASYEANCAAVGERPPRKRKGEIKLNCMLYQKNRRLSPSWASLRQNEGSSCSSSRQNEHCTRPCRSSSVQASGTSSAADSLQASADFLPATNRPQHRRQRCCGRLDLPMLASNPKCWRYQIQARENFPILSRAGPGSPRTRS